MKKVNSIKEYFDTLPARFEPLAAKDINAVFQYEITGEQSGTYSVTVKDDTFHVTEGQSSSPAVTIKVDTENHLKLINGELNGMVAFMKGLVKVEGNILLAQKLEKIFPPTK